MRGNLASIGKETVSFMEQRVADGHAIGKRISVARERTEHFKQEDVIILEPRPEYCETTLEVTREKTLAAGKRLLAEGYTSPCVLNFASARRPGGGFLTGASAQEEYLCRISGLYWCIREQEMHRRNNEVKGNKGLYLHDLLYSPDVPVFRDSDTHDFLQEDDVFDVAIITCPSPNVGAIRRGTVSNEELSETMQERIRRILAVAANKGHDAMVLGAFGCGAFRNDPRMVANHFSTFLRTEFRGVFKKVIFGVYERQNGPSITVFRQVFGDSQRISPMEDATVVGEGSSTQNQNPENEDDSTTKVDVDDSTSKNEEDESTTKKDQNETTANTAEDET